MRFQSSLIIRLRGRGIFSRVSGESSSGERSGKVCGDAVMSIASPLRKTPMPISDGRARVRLDRSCLLLRVLAHVCTMMSPVGPSGAD